MTRAQLSQALRELKAGRCQALRPALLPVQQYHRTRLLPGAGTAAVSDGVELMEESRPDPELCQPVRRHRHSLSARRSRKPDIRRPSARAWRREYRRSLHRRASGRSHQDRAGPLHDRPQRLAGDARSFMKSTSTGTIWAWTPRACDLMRPAMYGAYHHITIPPARKTLPHDQLVRRDRQSCAKTTTSLP